MARGNWQGPLPDLTSNDGKLDLERMQNLVAVAAVMQKFLQTQAAYVGAHGVALRAPEPRSSRPADGGANAMIICRLVVAGGSVGSATTKCSLVYDMHANVDDPLSPETLLIDGDQSPAVARSPLADRSNIGEYQPARVAGDGRTYGLAFRGADGRWVLALAYGEQALMDACPP